MKLFRNLRTSEVAINCKIINNFDEKVDKVKGHEQEISHLYRLVSVSDFNNVNGKILCNNNIRIDYNINNKSLLIDIVDININNKSLLIDIVDINNSDQDILSLSFNKTKLYTFSANKALLSSINLTTILNIIKTDMLKIFKIEDDNDKNIINRYISALTKLE